MHSIILVRNVAWEISRLRFVKTTSREISILQQKILIPMVAQFKDPFGELFDEMKMGEVDESLVPDSIKEWYDGDSDEEDTFEEVESDVECEKGTHKWWYQPLFD